MLPKRLTLFGIVHLFVCTQFISAQCPLPTSPPTRSLAAPVISNGETLNSGTTKCYKNTGSLTSLTINGGTFIVDGTLTINSIKMNAGEIIIMPGASLSISSDNLILQGNARIFNYGYFYVFGHIYMMGAPTTETPNCIVNVSSDAIITTPANSLYIAAPNSTFVNNGIADFGWIFTDSHAETGCIILNNGSETRVGYIYNNKENSIIAPSGKACVSVTKTNSRITKTLTYSPNVKLAFVGSATCSNCTAPSPWGDAEIFTSAPSCAAIITLPVKFSNFKVIDQNRCNVLTWQMDDSGESTDFFLQHSIDGVNYKDHSRISKQSNHQNQIKDCTPTEGINYYRIKIWDRHTNTVSYSEVVSIKNKGVLTGSAYPNPFIDAFTITPLTGFSANCSGILRNDLGQQVPISLSLQYNSITVRTPDNLKPGMYFFQLSTETGKYNYRLVKK